MNRKSFTFRSSWIEAMSKQPDNIRLALFDAITRYAVYGEVPDEMDTVVEIAFTLIRAEIDSAPKPRKKSEKTISKEIPVATPDEHTTETPEAQTIPEPTAKPEPDPDIDPFDTAYDAIASRVFSNINWQKWLRGRADVYDPELARIEFKEYIRKRRLTQQYLDPQMDEVEFCNSIYESVVNDAVFSPEVTTPR